MKENERLNLDGPGGDYNCEIGMAEFIAVLKSCRESSPGYDEITYSMIKNSHHTMVVDSEVVQLRLWECDISRTVANIGNLGWIP